MRNKKIILTLILFLAFNLLNNPLQASEPVSYVDTVYIDDNYNASTPGWQYDHFNIIQDGIDALNDHGTAYVYNGLYTENIIINKTINLIGDDTYDTIIDGNQNGDVIFITADYVSVSNFTLKNSGSPSNEFEAGIHIDSDYNRVYNNIFSNNICGIYSLTVEYNSIHDNIFKQNSEYGFFAASSSDYTQILNNVFYQNNYSLRIQGSFNCRVIGNRFNDSIKGMELCCGSNYNKIYHNTFINNSDYNVFDIHLNNQYDNGNISGGNYWDDYFGSDADGDWIGDTPYDVTEGYTTDYYPLMYPWDVTGLIDVNQDSHSRGFPIRHAIDGDWAGAQNFKTKFDTITKIDIYLRKFGTPEFDLTVELRETAVDGVLLDSITIPQTEVLSTWNWLELDFTDITVTPGIEYFIVCPPAPSGVTTSFGYEWGYAFGNQYDDGAFWFTRDGGGLWRDLPTMYEFVFKTYGYS